MKMHLHLSSHMIPMHSSIGEWSSSCCGVLRYFNYYVRTAGSTDVLARLSALEVVPVSATSTINERLALAGARVIEPP